MKSKNRTYCAFTVNLHHDGIFTAEPLRFNVPLNIGIKELNTDANVEEFLNCGYENKWFVDLYNKHFDYDVLDLIEFQSNVSEGSDISDEYDFSEEDDDLDYVDLQTQGFIDESVPINNNIQEVDPDESN
ncbi:hypothetical protein Tco_1021014 [Tanacetum coccineum]